jgi:hypothetical protein
MSWKIKFLILAILAVPAFVGYPVVVFDSEIISGLTHGWSAYFFLVNIAIMSIHGRQFYAGILAVAALISMPVIFVGGTIAYLIHLLGLGYEAGQVAYSPHYVSVCITMLTVIPLALSLMAVVPFQRFEHKLLQNENGVSKPEKCILMFLRVFNHIVYFVIPNILETIREEGHYKKYIKNEKLSADDPAGGKKARIIKSRLLYLIQEMVQLAVESICASIQFIPLWALEISQLPNKSRAKGD